MAIPCLDLNNLDLNKLDSACAEWGVFALTGHGIDPQLTAEVLWQTTLFFERTSAYKNRIRRTAQNAWGFNDAELTKNRRDWKEIVDIGAAVHTGPLAGSLPQWPDQGGFKDTMQAWSNALHNVGLAVVDHICSALGTHTDLTAPFTHHSSFLRLNYYPICLEPAPEDSGFTPTHGNLGISHHSDAGAVTVLMQDAQPGLQVYRQDRWHTVMPIEGALVINMGDIVQVWSNDRYTAPIHRVLANSEKARISTPYFLNPSYDYNYQPLLDSARVESMAKYRPINWGEFRQKRTAGDYADDGGEVQISDFKVANQKT